MASDPYMYFCDEVRKVYLPIKFTENALQDNEPATFFLLQKLLSWTSNSVGKFKNRKCNDRLVATYTWEPNHLLVILIYYWEPDHLLVILMYYWEHNHFLVIFIYYWEHDHLLVIFIY